MLAAKPALFGLEPHDILPISLIALGDVLKTLPGHKLRGALTSACFQVPGMRHIYTWATAVSVDKKSLRRLLARNFSLCICPGGAHEVTFMRSNSDPETVLYLRSRLGLPRLAAEQPNGLSLIPCFCFNQRPTYDFFVPNVSLLHKLGRKVRSVRAAALCRGSVDALWPVAVDRLHPARLFGRLRRAVRAAEVAAADGAARLRHGPAHPRAAHRARRPAARREA